MRQSAAAGYVSSQNYTEYVGQIGVDVTLLRPSGTVEIDGVRLPVVTEGDFVCRPTPPLQVVSGTRWPDRACGRSDVHR